MILFNYGLKLLAKEWVALGIDGCIRTVHLHHYWFNF